MKEKQQVDNYAPLITACLGDSITFGFPYGPEFSWVNLVSLEARLTVINYGLNGDTTGGMLARLQRYIIPKKPDCVVITGGTNDAWMGCSLDEVKFNIERMVNLTRENDMRPVLGITIPVNLHAAVDFFGLGNLAMLSDRLELYKGWMWEYAGREKIAVIDFHSALVDPHTGAGLESLYTDNGHPNLDGYKKMAEQAVKTLMSLYQ